MSAVLETESQIIDKLGAIRKQMRRLTRQEEQYEAKLDYKQSRTILGEKYKGTVYHSHATWIDKDEVYKYVTPEQYAECLRFKEYSSVRISEL